MSKILIVGNPNSGKTTLFNNLTKSHNRVGNWHGVTTSVVEKQCKKIKKTVVDLPGIYSLQGFSEEEKCACEYLKKHKGEVVVNLLDATCLKRGLALTNELINNGIKPVLVVNKTCAMSDKVFDEIEQRTGLPIFYMDVRKKGQLAQLIETLSQNPTDIFNNFIKALDIESIAKYIDDFRFNITKWDKIFLSDYFAVPAFLAIVGFIFFLTFGIVGRSFTNLFSSYVDGIFKFILDSVKDNFGTGWFYNFLADGLFTGVGSVLGFMPQIFLLISAFNILEHSGYLARIAFVFDALLKKIGLTGKAVFSLIMGFGCTTSAVCTTRGLENKTLQRRAIYGLGYISCSAKLPVLSLLVSLFFTYNTALYVFLFYLIGFVLALFVSFLLSLKQGQKESLILEVPRLCVPKFSIVAKSSVYETGKFASRILTTVVSFSIMLWIVESFSFSFRYVGTNIEDSMLYAISTPISWLFKPLGFTAGMVVALVVGIVAKELVISAFAVINGVSANLLAASLVDKTSAICFDIPTAIAFVLFMVVYAPCVAALSSIRKETDSKQMWRVLISQCAVAYVLALIGRWLTIAIIEKSILKIVGIVILIASIILLVIKFFMRSKDRCEDCNDCKNLQRRQQEVN